MVTEHFVVVKAQAGGQRERGGDLPGVLDEQRDHVVVLHPTRAAGFHAEHPIAEFTTDDLGADHGDVLTGGLEGDVQLGIQGQLVAFQATAGARQIGLQGGELFGTEVGLHRRQFLRLGLVVPGIGIAVAHRRARCTVAAAADAAAHAGAGAVPDLLQALTLGHAEGQGAALVLGFNVSQ